MKPSQLYIKIFLSFVGVLVVTELVIFILFMGTAGRSVRDRFIQYNAAKVMVAKAFIEERAAGSVHSDLRANDSLKELLGFIGNLFQAKLWLSTPTDGRVLASFNGPAPDVSSYNREVRVEQPDGLKLYQEKRRHGIDFLAKVPLDLPMSNPVSLNVFFRDDKKPRAHVVFGLGLLVIGLIIALLVIPVSRIITKPIKQLRMSALQIADGDLDHRAELKTRDEIGDLGRTFNHMADRLNGMIRSGRELTANVSHELRSPLARIRVLEELIRDKSSAGDIGQCQRYLDEIREEIGRMDQLIGRILELSKLDLKAAPARPELLDPNARIEDCIRSYDPVFQRRGLSVMTHLAADCRVMMDPSAFFSVFSNLIDNAAKYTPENGRIDIETAFEPGWLTVRVSNSVESLGEDDLNRLFDPFYRGSTPAGQGTGLGLSIARRAVENHGGGIEARRTDAGLEISVRLPAARDISGGSDS